LPRTMFSLIVAVSGGTDWIDIMEPVKRISWGYQVVFTFYVLFVVVGVLNILTAVFMESAADIQDRDLTVQREIENLDKFLEDMLNLYSEFQPDHDGTISWEDFQKYLSNEHVEAYLSSHMLETTHARLLFRMLDHDNDGAVSIYEFVIGMLRLKGGAKTYDNRVLLQEIVRLKSSVKDISKQLSQMQNVSSDSF